MVPSLVECPRGQGTHSRAAQMLHACMPPAMQRLVPISVPQDYFAKKDADEKKAAAAAAAAAAVPVKGGAKAKPEEKKVK